MKQAQETRALAVNSRAGAEKLVGYLLDDFYVELAPVGRLELIGEMAKRASAYYQGLPAAMRTAETDANHARALLRLGDVQENEGKAAEADLTYRRSIALIEPVIADGKASDADRLVLADALNGRASAAIAGDDFTAAKKLIDRSVGMASPLALAPGASQAARLSYARARTRAGYIKLRSSNDMDGAVVELNAARAVLSDVAERRASMPVMIAYLKAGQWLQECEARGDSTDYARAEALAQEDLLGIAQVLQRQPNHKQALVMRDAVRFMRGFFAFQQRNAGLALKIFANAAAMQREALRSDPDNQFIVDAVVIDLGWQGRALASLGRPHEVTEIMDEIWSLYKNKAASTYQANNLYTYAYQMATIHAELGERDKIGPMIERFHGYLRLLKSGKNSSEALAISLMGEASEIAVADIAGDTASPQALVQLRQRSEGLLAQSHGVSLFYVQVALLIAHRAAAHQAFAAGDYARAEAESGAALKLHNMDISDVARPVFLAEHALALARLRRLPEARALVKLALDEQRAQIAAGSDDQTLRMELAQSLYVSALTQPTAGMAELKEAAALLDRLPAEMQAYRTVRLWRGRIADEMRLNTRAGLAAGSAS
ncbi:hypothetical protein [Rugamonas sp.]|uniref:hypothetical protein n=1 Tax=Rugamonas sp. TaxID=1926287 RepID=UPI0025F6B35F|nr:hypothetical protein [Rugamonas sp.]